MKDLRFSRMTRGLAVLASSSFLVLSAVGTAAAHPTVNDDFDTEVSPSDALAALICTYSNCDDIDELTARIDQILGESDEDVDQGDVADPEDGSVDEAEDEADDEDESDDEDDESDDEDEADDEDEDESDDEDDESDDEDEDESDDEDEDEDEDDESDESDDDEDEDDD